METRFPIRWQNIARTSFYGDQRLKIFFVISFFVVALMIDTLFGAIPDFIQDRIISGPGISLFILIAGAYIIGQFFILKFVKERTKEMELWSKILIDVGRKVKDDVKMTIMSANNHYAGFGPMTAKLFEQMLNLKEKIKSFPIQDYKPSSDDIVDTKNTYSKFYRLKHQKTKQSSISDFFK